MKKFRFLTPIVAAFAVALLLGGHAHAADYTNSHLMDDQVFDNVGSLSQTQIDDFLHARTGPFTKLGTASPCLSGYNDINFRWDGTDWYYGDNTRVGNSTGWVSQAFTWNTAWGPAQIPASQIIYKSAQMWGFNPEVLISTLQKEESLITGTSCDTWRYNSAMGYGCPDSGGCNAKYAGFTRQVLWGGWQLKFNKERSIGNTAWDDDGSITYGGFMTQGTRKRCATCASNYYDGYATIDGQSIFLENGTTASLYTYTPHLGQSFPGIFEGWFGSTITQGTTSPLSTTWNFETLDGKSPAVNVSADDTGHASTAIQFGTDLHVFYYDATAAVLKHGVSTTGGWSFSTLDGAGGGSGQITGNVGTTPTATVFNNVLHVFYYDSANHTLRHASSADGSTWQFETLDGAGGNNGRIMFDVGMMPTATGYSGTLQVFYYSTPAGDLRHAWMDTGNIWHFETLDGNPASVAHADANLGLDPMVVSYGTSLQLFYYDIQNGNLRHAWSNASGWHFENLDGDLGAIGHWNANIGLNPAATLYGTTLQLFYYDAQYGNIRHAWSDNTGWHFENLDGDIGSIGHWNLNTGAVPSVVVLGSTLYVYYYDVDGKDLRIAWSDNLGWQFNTLDGLSVSASTDVGQVGQDSTAVSFNGNIQLFYYDAGNTSLRHAWGTPK